MDQSEQSGNPRHSHVDDLVSHRMERAVLAGCVLIGVIGVSILLMVATHAHGGSVGLRLG